MVALVQKYTEAELKSQSTSFYAGEGWVKCQIHSSAKVPNPYKKEGETKPDVIAIYYDVISGSEAGVRGHVYLELFDDSPVTFPNGGSAPRSKGAFKKLRDISIAAGHNETIYETDLLNGRTIEIEHKTQELRPVKDAEGNETGQFYPPSSEPKKFRKAIENLAAQVAAIVPPAQPQVVAPVAAPVAPAAGLYPPAAAVAPAPVTAAVDLDDEIPFA
jgi:hypothetical protein